MTGILPSSPGDNHETSVAERPQSHATPHNRILGDPGASDRQFPNPADTPPDPFDPARLRLSQDFGAGLGVKKALMTVPVRKPAKEWWVQTHPEETYRIQTGVLELKEDREIYLVDPELWPILATESTFGPRLIVTAITRQAVCFLWPIRLPSADGKLDDWNRSAIEAATRATGKWCRVQANMALGAYDCLETIADLPAPEWPDVTFHELLKVAFKDRFIQDLDHPVLARLQGRT